MQRCGAPRAASATQASGGVSATPPVCRARHGSLRHLTRRARLDPRPLTGQSPRPGRVCVMKLLSHLSPAGDGLPEPADERRLALGFEAWHQALSLAQDDPASTIARRWSTAPPGKRLLASLFGN